MKRKIEFKKKHCIQLRTVCISVKGVDLWNGLGAEMKHSININHLKKNYKNIFGWYIREERLCQGCDFVTLGGHLLCKETRIIHLIG